MANTGGRRMNESLKRALGIEAAIELPVVQAGHGFVVGDAIRVGTDGVYVKAQADAPENAGILGIVNKVTGDKFTFKYGGILTSGTWKSGVSYFLSPSTAGELIEEPTYAEGEVRQYVGTGVPEGLLIGVDIGDEILAITGVGGGGTWGSIIGTLSDQTDLQEELDYKMSYILMMG